MLRALRRLLTPRAAKPSPAHILRELRASFDAAQTTPENYRHWGAADALDANLANNAHVRRVLRMRSRYEIANNGYAKGINNTLARWVIGRGPRLQMLSKDDDANETIEHAWREWAKQIKLAQKLRTMRKARAGDGEAFAILTTNPRVRGDVQLDLRLVEADQVTTPDLNPLDPNAVDGIRFDEHGNPTEYHVLKDHPGGIGGRILQYDRIPARFVIHWFEPERPGQARGVPETTAGLDLIGQLRRFTRASLSAAEIAAAFAAVMKTQSAPYSEESCAPKDPFEGIEIDRGMLTALPAGWEMQQYRAEHPATTYPMFKGELINEYARGQDVPFNIAAGNSSSYNYSSGRLDHQSFLKLLDIERETIQDDILDRIVAAWIDEAVMSGLLDAAADPLEGWPHAWYWDGLEHIDPTKETAATTERLKNRTTTLAIECGKDGRFWKDVLDQVAAEEAYARQLGTTLSQSTPTTPPTTNANATDEADDSEDDTENAARQPGARD